MRTEAVRSFETLLPLCKVHQSHPSRPYLYTDVEKTVPIFFFDVLLTVHLSIFILVVNQLDA